MRLRTLTIILALSIGTAGGILFYLARLPLPWMIGAMAATTAASMAGLRLSVPPLLRNIMLTVLGLLLGSGFAPDTVGHLGEWAVTLLGLVLYVVAAGWMTFQFLRRFGGYDPVTAFFSGMPGGLNEMVAVGHAMGGDERSISLIHALRVLIVVTCVVFWFRIERGYSGGGAAATTHFLDVPWIDLLIMAASGAVGAVAARKLRFPAPFVLGPMIVSSLVHLTGITHARPPIEISAAAQVVIGSTLGCRFSGVPFAFIGKTFWRGVASTALLLASAIGASLLLAAVTGIPGHIIMLAFAPGGLAEMTLVGLSLGVDVSFIAFHHLARVVMVFSLAPLFFRLVTPRKPPVPLDPPAVDGL